MVFINLLKEKRYVTKKYDVGLDLWMFSYKSWKKKQWSGSALSIEQCTYISKRVILKVINLFETIYQNLKANAIWVNKMLKSEAFCDFTLEAFFLCHNYRDLLSLFF